MNAASSDTVELSIVMPCLNEAQTLAVCIRKGRRFLETSGVIGEIVVADNCSTDESRAGADLVVGNRFRGGIATGAMPLLHRFLGNPVLSFLGRLFFRIDIGDFHCGLRGFVRDRILAIDLRSIGMEFASEIGPLVPHTSVDHGVYSPQRGATG